MFKLLRVSDGFLVAPLLVIAGLLSHFANPSRAVAAQVQREVRPSTIATKLSPVVVTKVMLGDKTVQKGLAKKISPDPITAFLADDSWVRNLKVYLLNRTNRTIVYLFLYFGFPDTTIGQTRAFFTLPLGRLPSSIAVDRQGKPLAQRPDAKEIMFLPHETMVVNLGDYAGQLVAALRSAERLSAQTTITVNLSSIYFEDGMWWNGGSYNTLDWKNLAWRPMDPNYFPGDVEHDWPGSRGSID
jgi:hypothetical protein